MRYSSQFLYCLWEHQHHLHLCRVGLGPGSLWRLVHSTQQMHMLCDFVYSHSHICLIYIVLVNNTDGNTNFGLMPYEFVIIMSYA